MSSIKNPRNTLEKRRELRKEMTPAEKILWNEVRNKKLSGVRFKRQYGLGPYILDFFVPKASLAIEVDGGIHDRKEVKKKDINKDAFLERNDIDVLRITNQDVLNDLNNVMRFIRESIEQRREQQP